MVKKKSRKKGSRPCYSGKPLWQILDNLPNHGVGRLIVRGSHLQNEGVPNYMRILKVDMSSKAAVRTKPGKIRIPVTVERTRRGVTLPRPVNICSTSHLSDFKLVPKDEEEKYLKDTKGVTNEFRYWTTGQKKRVKALIEQGMSPYEAKQMVSERNAREQAEAAERDGVEPSKEPAFKIDPSNFSDNFDDVMDEGETEDSFDSDYVPEEKVQKKKNKGRNINDFSEEFPDQEDFGKFSPEQELRIEKMIQNGMAVDTAKQLEWERQIAFETAAANGFNESEAGRSTNS